jgi:hypothetical protein
MTATREGDRLPVFLNLAIRLVMLPHVHLEDNKALSDNVPSREKKSEAV